MGEVGLIAARAFVLLTCTMSVTPHDWTTQRLNSPTRNGWRCLRCGMRVILEESQTFEEYFLMSSKKGKWRYEDCDYVIVNRVHGS